jgi:PAS domain S-box-containing protein
LFHISNTEIVGKTDHDFLPIKVAESRRNSDLEVAKVLKELESEEIIQEEDGPHTYLAVRFPLYDASGRIYAIGGISTDISLRKKLEESSKAADTFFNASLDMLVIASSNKFVKVNPATTKILGYTEEELLNNPFLKYLHPDDIDITNQEVAKLQAGAVTLKFENRYICKDNSTKWILWSVYPDVATGLLYAVGRDETEKKENEKSLNEAQKFFNMSHDILVVAKGEYFEKVNPAFIKNLGYDQKEIEGKPFLSIVHPDDTNAYVDAINKLKNGEAMVNHSARARCRDESYKWLDWSNTIDIQTGIMYAVARDITEFKKNEESIKMADMFFNMSFDILAVAKGEHFIKINPALTRTLGYTQQDLDILKFMDLIHSEDLNMAKEILELHLKGSPVVDLRLRFLCKDGTYKWLDWNSNIDVQQGVFYSVGRDITELILLEEEQKVSINNLYDNEKKLRLIVENINEGIIVANADEKIILANHMANEIFGIKEDDKISTNLISHFELYFPDEKTVFPSQKLPMERALNGEETNDIDVVLLNPVTQEKKRVLISGRSLVDLNNNVVAAVVTIKDITQYKKLEKELKETESKYRQLIGFKKGDDPVI